MQKRQRALALALLPHLAIVRHSDYGGVIVLDVRSLTPRQLAPVDVDVILGLEHQWHIHTSIFLESLHGAVVKTEEHDIKQRYKQADLVHYIQEFHLNQLKSERQDMVAGYGWIATAVPRELTEEYIDRIYTAAVAAAAPKQ